MAPFVRPRSKNHPLGTYSLVYTKQIVPSMYQELLSWSRLISITQVFRTRPYKLPSIKNILGARHYFSYIFFRALVGACVNPRNFSLFVHSLVCQITHSFLNGFQSNLYQHFSHACMLYLSYYFQPEVST